MYATALACPGWRGSREPTPVSAMRWSFIFAGSIAAMAFATVLHSSSRWHGVRLGTGTSDAPGPDEAGGARLGAVLGEAAGGALPAGVGEGASSTRAGPPHADPTKRSTRTPPTRRIT